MQGCEQVNVDYEVKAGGVTGTLDTASFELFRLACTEFFNKMPPEEGRCVIDYSEDKLKKALVQQTYSDEHHNDDHHNDTHYYGDHHYGAHHCDFRVWALKRTVSMRRFF